VLAGVLADVASDARTSHRSVGVLVLSVASGPPGTVVQVAGNAGPGCVVDKNWHGFDFEPDGERAEGPVTEMTTLVASSGSWSAAFVVPSYLGGPGAERGRNGAPVTPGRYELVAPTCEAHVLAKAPFQVTAAPPFPAKIAYVAIAATPDGQGYWLVRADGAVAAFGDARLYGSPRAGKAVPAVPVVGAAAAHDGRGYWLVRADGHVYSFGDARSYGSLPGGNVLEGPVAGIAATPDGRGYWLVGADGHVYRFGDARYDGEPDGHLAPYDAIAARPAGGYVVTAASDAAVYRFTGDALWAYGPGTPLSGMLVGTAATPSGNGTWQAGADGGVFTSGDATYYGSVPGDDLAPSAPVTGIAGSPDGHGYWLVGADGTVYNFGDAHFYGMVFEAPPS
jgi:ribosomal protein L24E